MIAHRTPSLQLPAYKLRVYLFDDVNAVVELLSLQHGMQVRQQYVEMLSPIAVRHDDGDPMSGNAVARSADTARQHGRVLTDDLCLRVVVFMLDIDEHSTPCTVQLHSCIYTVSQKSSHLLTLRNSVKP